MTERDPVHPMANEAALRCLAGQLQESELKHAIAVGNLAWKAALLRDHAELLKKITDLVKTLDFDFIDDALRRRKDDRVPGQCAALAKLRAGFTDTADKVGERR